MTSLSGTGRNSLPRRRTMRLMLLSARRCGTSRGPLEVGNEGRGDMVVQVVLQRHEMDSRPFSEWACAILKISVLDREITSSRFVSS